MIGDRLLKFYRGRRSIVHALALAVLFWNVFDCTMTYITPLVIEAGGFSKSMIGFIYGFSSIVGAIFDFLVGRIFKNTHFRRMFLILFLVCATYPLMMWQAKGLGMFLFVMAIWGVYYDLYNFGTFDFIGRYLPEDKHSSAFGLMMMLRGVASIIAPIIIGFVAYEALNWKVYAIAWAFLAIGFVFLLDLLALLRHTRPVVAVTEQVAKRGTWLELRLWRKVSRPLLPVLVLTFFLFLVEAFFWTLGPLFAEEIKLDGFGGFFLTAYSLPTLLLGWLVGRLTRRWGKKRTAFLGLFIGSLVLATFAHWHNPIVLILVVFAASCFLSISMPSINGAYADYIAESPLVEGEIQGIEDFAFNMGYFFGPLASGILADAFGMPQAFSILGIGGAILAVILLFVTPSKISVPNAVTS